ncbi:alkaline phosphatase [Cetobacterium sp. 2A]|uniref:alkaline phosphatase n=1 Tax=Cetobacterium sp. 2A TaxID=2754723 RepID=UPI00163C445D|nr:alkaline phosphatase [Cetobacterium sp. 2A]MBC2854920.1 alkaline phosphatase [Cetobacterium sp. 2A]
MKKFALASIILSATMFSTNQELFSAKLEEIKPGFAKNVIVLISDGTPVSTTTLARWVYNDGKPLNVDEIVTGMSRTHNSDTAIADSAPAGTAIATGWKTQDKLIGVKPAAATLYGAKEVKEDDKLAPAASVLEAAKLMGKAVGVIATSEITHATPADFTAHSTHRNNYSDIGEQQVFQGMNVIFGGGKSFFNPSNDKDDRSKNRTDGEDMVEAIKNQNYKIVYDVNEMNSVDGEKVWGFFAEKDMDNDLDRDPKKQPSLAQMTEKAIDLLKKDKDGFFLMVEGSKVDWASHANSPVAQISDYKAFDAAVGVALDYAKKNKDTLVVVTTDHATGGLTIGNASTSKSYPEHPIEDFVSVLKKAKATEGAVAKQIVDNKAEAKTLVLEKLGYELSPEELKEIDSAKNAGAIETILANGMSSRSRLGWTTNGHTGEDVPFYAYTSNPQDTLSGTIQNSDIALYMAKAINADLDKVTDELFVSGKKIKAMGIDLKIDNSIVSNPKFILSKNGKEYTFFENKNYFEVDGKKQDFNGIVIYNEKEVFIPQAALNKIK